MDNDSMPALEWFPHLDPCGQRSTGEVFYDTAKHFTSVTIIAIILIGLVCNILSFVVFLTRDMLKRSVSRYLLVLSCSDNLYLMMEFLSTWFAHRSDVVGTLSAKEEANTVHSNPDLCRATKYLGTASRFISSWIIVTFTAERALATYTPLKYGSYCNLFRTNVSVAVTVAAGLVLTTYNLHFAEVQHRGGEVRCAVPTELYDAYRKFTYAFVAMTYFIPLTVILVLNVLIIYRLRRDAGRLVRRGNDSPGGGGRRRQQEACCAGRSDRKITITLVVVSKVFFLLNFPYIIAWSAVSVAPPCGPEPGVVNATLDATLTEWCACRSASAVKHGLLTLFSSFHALNYAINFFLYCVTGKIFRAQLAKIFCREGAGAARDTDHSTVRSDVASHGDHHLASIPLTTRTNGVANDG